MPDRLTSRKRPFGTASKAEAGSSAGRPPPIQTLVLENMVEGVNVTDTSGVIRFTNRAFDAMFGYAPGELVGQHISILNALPPEENARRVKDIIRALKTRGVWEGTFRNRRKDNSLFSSRARITAFRHGGRTLWVSVQQDVTAVERVETALRENNARLRILIEQIPAILWSVDKDLRITLSQGKGLAALGERPDQHVGRLLTDVLGTTDPNYPPLAATRRALAGESVSYEMEWHGRRYQTRIDPLTDAGGGIVGCIGLSHDVTDLKRAEENARRYAEELQQRNDELRLTNDRLEALALVDPLTELLNRRGLQRSLSHLAGLSQRQKWDLSAILVDLDDFKRINDTLGHAVGDVVLKEVAAKFRSALRETDHVARIGGDEFLALLPQTAPEEGLRIAERVRLAVSATPVSLASGPVTVTASLGLSPVTPEIAHLDELVALCHHALKRSKAAGKNRVSRIDPSRDGPGAPEDHPLSPALQALRRGEALRVVKHPLFRLSNGLKTGYEMLIRSTIPSFENPNDFFRLCYEANILTSVDRQCLARCAAVAREIPEGLRFHVNLFPSTLMNVPARDLVGIFAPHPHGGVYCLELNEQQILGDPSYLVKPIAELKRAGILIAIDDVGFGRSCLENLILLEPDVIKIDRRCIDGIARDPVKAGSLMRLLSVAKSLGVEIMAEGIETREDLAILKSLGVTYGQGFLWGKPS